MNYGVLKAKSKALAVEAQHLRKEIVKTGGNISWSIHNGENHNRYGQGLAELQRTKAIVRQQARHVHLARAIMKGQEYEKVESSNRENKEPIRLDVLAEMTGFSYSKLSTWLMGYNMFEMPA